VAKKPPPAKAEGDAPNKKSALDKKAEARAFLGKKGLITVDGMKPIYGPGAGRGQVLGGVGLGGAPVGGVGMSAAALASAALAQRVVVQRKPDASDALAEFRSTGTWKAPAIYNALDGATPPQAKGRAPSAPVSLVATVRALLGIALYGEVKGVRMLVAALGRFEGLTPELLRELDGIGRMAGARQIALEQLQRLISIALEATAAADAVGPVRADLLVGQLDGVRPIAGREHGVATPKQLVELRAREACLVILDLPVRGASVARRPREYAQVVGLLRSLGGDLVMVDPDGLFDPVKGTHDASVRYSVLHRAQEIGLADFIAGTGVSPPQSPVARLICNSYLSAATPRDLGKESIPVVGGLAFHFI